MKKFRRIINMLLIASILLLSASIVYANNELEGSAPSVVTTDGTYMYYRLGDSIYRELLSGGERKLIYRPYTYFNNEYVFWNLDATDLQYYNGYLYIGEYSSIYRYWVNIDKINLNNLSKEDCEEDYVFTRRIEQGQYYQGEIFIKERGLGYKYGISKLLNNDESEAIISWREGVGAFCIYDEHIYYISSASGYNYNLNSYNLKTGKTEVLVENMEDVVDDVFDTTTGVNRQINCVGNWLYLFDGSRGNADKAARTKIGEWNFEILEETEEEKNQIPSTEGLNDNNTTDIPKDIFTGSNYRCSTWAKNEVEDAYQNGLIPEVLQGEDLTQKIDRAEFASVAVLVYENISNTTAPNASSPFNDISSNPSESDINRAYGLGITTGTSRTTFDPDTLITREQLATMLCRAIKKYKFPEWTIDNDDEYFFGNISGKRFADHDQIEDYAKDSVYFMASAGIIKGVDDTHFAPKATTTREEAIGYGMATREQAVIMANRIRKAKDYIDAQ